MESWDSIDSIMTGLWAGRLKIHGSIPARGKGFISFAKHPGTLDPTPSTGSLFFCGFCGRGMNQTIDHHLVLRLGMTGAVPPILFMVRTGQIYLSSLFKRIQFSMSLALSISKF